MEKISLFESFLFQYLCSCNKLQAMRPARGPQAEWSASGMFILGSSPQKEVVQADGVPTQLVTGGAFGITSFRI